MGNRSFSAAILAFAFLCAGAAAQDLKIDIPFQKFVLPNGLTLIVHEDHKAPIVAVNLWYHVGSKNEQRGRTGFAHLFEHLMFNGSENFNQDYFKVLERIGATDLNGTTNNDRTNYFQTVPTTALDTVLWMESDRMGHLLGAIDKARLDEQRGVVQNEKRQGENQPYGKAYELISTNTYPANHPYSWTVIGSMEDLNAASLEDVHQWFKTYYGPSNATIVIAGDIDAKTAREKVERYFGHIAPGPPIARHQAWVARRTGAQRQVMQDRVPQARLYKVWNTPQSYTVESTRLLLAGAVLGQGRTSRLYQRLVHKEQLATDVMVYQSAREIAGQFMVVATARPGVELARVEKAIDEEMARFLASGPTAEELGRVKTRSMAGLVRGLERTGGFGGKSDVLASGQVYAGDPGAYQESLRQQQAATPEEVKAEANAWLTDGVYVLEVLPFPTLKAVQTKVDRSKVPDAGTPPAATLPKLQRATLSNGLKLVLAERHDIPVVDFELLVSAGAATDQLAVPGTANLATGMLTAGTKTRSMLRIGEESEGLGAVVSASSSRDLAAVYLSALKNKLDQSMALWADIVLNPAYEEAEFRRLQKQTLAGIAREKSSPASAAMRIFPAMVFGSGHPYGTPATGTEKSVASITRESLAKFHATWFKPNNATLAIVGDTTLAEIRPKLEKLFAAWKPGDVPKASVPAVAYPENSVVYLIDRPGAPQSVIVAGHVAPPRNNPEEIAIEALNTVLGGASVSRVNMNLREDKHWTYGARTAFAGGAGQRLFYANAPVQTDKTRESMVEIQKEIAEIVSSRPVSDEELALVREQRVLRIPGQFETSGAVLGSIVDIVRHGLPDNYFDTYAARMRALDKQQVSTAAERTLKAAHMVWVVVGDRARVEPAIRDLGYGELRVVDVEGNPAR